MVHRAPAHLKILALLAFVLVWPSRRPGPYGVYLLVLVAVIGVSQVPPPYLLKRMVVEVPFVLFAVLMPFLSTGPRTDFLGLTVSEPGLMAAWALLAKGTLGVLASLTLAATTEPHALLAGLERLRLPRQLVQIMSFMVRYLDVVTDEMRRMKVAPSPAVSRPATGRWRPQRRRAVHPVLRTGERVHLAMLSGYTGVSTSSTSRGGR